jgi:predicted molibdopterin-dependent oxidoreductase YjgC
LFLTETAKLADVVLPSASYAEDDGTFSSLSGRVQRIRPSVPQQAEARPDWRILLDLARSMKADFGYPGPEAVMREVAKIAPLYGEHSWDMLAVGGRLVRYGEAPKRVGRAEYAPPPLKEGSPFALATGQMLYDGDALLSQTAAFDEMVPQPYLAMNPGDAAGLGVKDGSKVTVRSSAGKLSAMAHLTEDVCPGCVFMPHRMRDMLAVALLEDGPVTRVAVGRG